MSKVRETLSLPKMRVYWPLGDIYGTFFYLSLIIKKLVEFKEDNWCKYAMFLIRRVKDMYDLAKEKEKGQVYGLCLHFSRFCIELSLKSIFPIFKNNVPYVHDVNEKVSDNLRKQIIRKA